MSKKTNSLIFMVIATIVNVVILLVFLGVIVLSFFTYSKLVKWLNKRFNLEDKMDPLFSGGRNRRGKTD